MKTLKASAAYVLALALFFPALAFAQTEGRFVGVVLDPDGRGHPGRHRRRQERADGRHADGHVQRARDATSSPNLPPSVYTIRATFGEPLAPLEFTGLQLVAAQEFALDLSLDAGRASPKR